jgi:tetratricopeptide (TPR) repeat protein
MDSIEKLLRLCADGSPQVSRFADLARLQEQSGQGEAALKSYLIATLLQAALLSPLDAANWLQLGLAFHRAGDGERAAAAFRAALAVHPAMAEACNNLGGLGSEAAAVRLLSRAVRLEPARADFHVNLAHALLGAGRWAQGFREWEWRALSPPRDFTQPRWKGQELPDATLLVHVEQGYGDCIQFARYLPAAAARVGRLLVESRLPLAGLLRRVEGVAEIIPWGEKRPPFDLQIPLPSLAAWLPPPPWRGPYLQADPERVGLWRRKTGPVGERKRVGLVWSGNPRGHDPRRAMPFAAIAAFAESHPHCQFFGLQRELPEAGSIAIPQLGNHIEDFDDLAAAILSMDLLVSVDTAAAHLAGALGKDVRVLLHRSADWRWWGPEPTRSVWYPSAKLYRQTRPGDWREVLARVSRDLE